MSRKAVSEAKMWQIIGTKDVNRKIASRLLIFPILRQKYYENI